MRDANKSSWWDAISQCNTYCAHTDKTEFNAIFGDVCLCVVGISTRTAQQKKISTQFVYYCFTIYQNRIPNKLARRQHSCALTHTHTQRICIVDFFLHIQMEVATIAADTAHCREFKAQLLSLKGIISVQFIALCCQFFSIFSRLLRSCLFLFSKMLFWCSVSCEHWTCWKTTCNMGRRHFLTTSIRQLLWRYFHFGMCCSSHLFFFIRFFFSLPTK